MEVCKKHDKIVVVWESLDLSPKCPLCEAYKEIDEQKYEISMLESDLMEWSEESE